MLHPREWHLRSVMPFSCSNGRCDTPRWMGKVLLAAGIYHVLFAIWANVWPCQWFDLIGAEHPNHPLLWRGAGLVAGALGISFLASARNPVRHWQVLGIGLAKFTLGIVAFLLALSERQLPPRAIWVMFVNDLIWWGPFAIILWAGIRSYCGVPPTRAVPYSVAEAARSYKISEGVTLEQASKDQLIALVFLRHFGCTFTRQLLRGLEGIQQQADEHGAKLIFVHMLQNGGENRYLGTPGSISRIADPRCELYRAFGLEREGFSNSSVPESGGMVPFQFSEDAASVTSRVMVYRCPVRFYFATEGSFPPNPRNPHRIFRIFPFFSTHCPQPQPPISSPHDTSA